MNEYLVIGERDGEPFEIKKEAPSSHTACAEVRDALLTTGHEIIEVKAIKMKSPFSQKFTIVVPSDLYL